MFIIYGWKTSPRVIAQGDFHCPSCRQPTPYEHVDMAQYITLFFIPIIPIGSAGKFVKCQLCQSAFTEAVLALPALTSPTKESDDEFIPLIGSRILGFKKGFWYPGTIRSKNKHVLGILFDDGSHSDLGSEQVMPLDLRVDDPIFARKEPGGNFYPAYIQSIFGKDVEVRFDDGTNMPTKLAMVRVVWEDTV
jgi:hypothetical protein